MDSFEWNKVLMAVLCALLLVKTVDIIADHVVHPKYLEKNVYVVQGVEQSAAAPQANKAEEPQLIEPLLAQANLENGQKVAKLCLQCHTLDKGGKNINGPNLWGVVDHPIGKREGYAYSSAMQAKGGNWGVEDLNHFLLSPRAYISGTKMSFIGLKKVDDRRDLIAYLKTLKG